MERLSTIAALFVSPRSVYTKLPAVECYTVRNPVANFAGGKPVVAHPPCRCWSKLRHQVTLDADSTGRERQLGIDAVSTVMREGGVLEQPAGSLLWDACQLSRPGRVDDPFCYTIYVEQSWFGFPTPKPTWLLICGVPRSQVQMPDFNLRCQNPRSFNELNSFERSRTMGSFAEWLCQIARSTWWQLPGGAR